MRPLWFVACCVFVALQPVSAEERPACAADPGPRKAVESFMQAMQARKFEEAYQYVTANMTDGRPVDGWAALQKKMFDLGGVSIGQIDVRDATIEVVDGKTCAPRAKVPNVLRAGDVLNTQGSVEFELYDMVLENGKWQIDAQDSLYQEDEIRRWFPGDVIPKFDQTRRSFLPGWIRIPKDIGNIDPDAVAKSSHSATTTALSDK